ncbi:hypothetical protein CRM22_001127 [Opisthorchis felineus]|uniref:Uncharacterized protein n=1 Tax=Opisthorchis felineus TaxID=147828 RepID=A0A4S2MBZ2_OPIFE|nr:hypothetical protein CRM22_001127 [Opisthorchis felineus]
MDEFRPCQRGKPAQIYSQDLSSWFPGLLLKTDDNKIFDYDTATFLSTSKKSDDLAHQDFVRQIEEDNQAYDLVVNGVRLLKETMGSMKIPRNEDSKLVNDYRLFMDQDSMSSKVPGSLGMSIQDMHLLSKRDIFLHGKPITQTLGITS